MKVFPVMVCAFVLAPLLFCGAPAAAIEEGEDHAVTASLEGGRYVEDIAFVARCDGTTQRYVCMYPGANPSEAYDGILIALHGHGSDRWQFIRDGRDECRAVRDVAAKRRLLLVSPDYRAKTSWMGPAAEADLVQIIEGLKASHDLEKVYLCGGSMGGTAVLIFAALHPDLTAGAASMNGTANLVEYDQFQDAIAASYGGSKCEVPEEYKKRSPELHAERLTMPVAVTAGALDEVVPAASVLRLAAHLEQMERAVLLVYDEAGGHQTCYKDAVRSLTFILAPPQD